MRSAVLEQLGRESTLPASLLLTFNPLAKSGPTLVHQAGSAMMKSRPRLALEFLHL